VFRSLIYYLVSRKRRWNRRGFPAVKNFRHSSASHNSHTYGEIAFGSAEILHKGFAYLMNNQIKGHYAEFGVFEGSTTLEACFASRIFGLDDLEFFVFDSFQGLPDLERVDGSEVFTKGQFSSSLIEFRRNLMRERVDFSKFHIFPGFYNRTLPTLKLNKTRFAFVLVDCDLYSSTVSVLDFLTDKLVQGAIIAFDDWYCYDSPDKGERLAVSEWLARNPMIELIEYSNFHWAGKSFIVNLK
jgi:O-methyltransferase